MFSRRCILFIIYVVVLPIISLVNCSREHSTNPGQESSASFSRTMISSETMHVVYTALYLDSVLNDTLNPALVSGDTIYLVGDSTFLMTKKYSIVDKSLTFLGGNPRPTLHPTGPGSGVFLNFVDEEIAGSHRIEFDNIDFEPIDFSGNVMLKVIDYGTVSFKNSSLYLVDDFVDLEADYITVDSCLFEGHPSSFLYVRSRDGVDFDHEIKRSVFSNDATSGAPSITSSRYDDADGELDIDDCVFSATYVPNIKYFHAMTLYGTESNTVELNLLNNNFGDTEFKFTDLANNHATANVYYDENISDLELCVSDLFSCTGCGTESLFDIDTFIYGDYVNDFDIFGDSLNTNPLCEVDCDTAYVKFYVGGTVLADAFVLYGDESASGDSVSAEYDQSTNSWYCYFDVSGFTDYDFYWKPGATLCGVTEVGNYHYKHFRPANCVEVPEWWPHQQAK